MSETLDITTAQVNDLPLLRGIVEDRGIRQMTDARIRPHGGWQGISVGTLVSIWLCHLLMECDHRPVSVRDWAGSPDAHRERVVGHHAARHGSNG